jgi:hypothetical protein
MLQYGDHYLTILWDLFNLDINITMRQLLLHLFFYFTLILFNNSCGIFQKQQQYEFIEMKKYQKIYGLNEINVLYATHLNKDKLVLIGSVLSKEVQNYIGQKLFVIEIESKKILFESEAIESPFGGNLYEVIINNKHFILWEIKNENASELKLFLYRNGKCNYLYDFDITLKSGNYEDYSYPIENIAINFLNDTLLLFKFDENISFQRNGNYIYKFDIINEKIHGVR